MLKSDSLLFLLVAGMALPSVLYFTRPVSLDETDTDTYPHQGFASIPQQNTHAVSSEAFYENAGGETLNDDAELQASLANIPEPADKESNGGADIPAREVSERYKNNPVLPVNYPANSGQRSLAAADSSRRDMIPPEQAASETITDSRGMSDQNPAGSTTGRKLLVANGNLYLAEMQAPPPGGKTRCPPVYMGLNDYARNMRAAMGCDSE